MEPCLFRMQNNMQNAKSRQIFPFAACTPLDIVFQSLRQYSQRLPASSFHLSTICQQFTSTVLSNYLGSISYESHLFHIRYFGYYIPKFLLLCFICKPKNKRNVVIYSCSQLSSQLLRSSPPSPAQNHFVMHF